MKTCVNSLNEVFPPTCRCIMNFTPSSFGPARTIAARANRAARNVRCSAFCRTGCRLCREPLAPKQRWTLAIGAALLTLLLAAVFTFGSLDVNFEPGNWRQLLPLYAVSSFITAAFLVFLMILMRTVLRLWAERSKEQLGARFKTKMVVGAMALSLLPVLFMFFVSS